MLEKIKSALEDRNLKEVSKRAGVAYSAIRKISQGQDNISTRTTLRLAKYLGVIENDQTR